MGMKLLREVFDWLMADLKAFFKNPFKWVWKKIRLGAKRDREKKSGRSRYEDWDPMV